MTTKHEIEVFILKELDNIANYGTKRRIEIFPESFLIKDLNLDSLDAVELVISIEEKFNISISDEEILKIEHLQVKQLISFLENKIIKKQK